MTKNEIEQIAAGRIIYNILKIAANKIYSDIIEAITNQYNSSYIEYYVTDIQQIEKVKWALKTILPEYAITSKNNTIQIRWATR